MFDRTVEPDPRTAAPPSRNRYRMRDGHRREYAASRDRGSISFPERCARGLADIGVYGAVSYRDLAEARFGGHPYTTRRGRERLGTRRARHRDHGHRTRGQPVQGPDPHPQPAWPKLGSGPPNEGWIPARKSGSHAPGLPRPRTTPPSTAPA